MTLSQRRDQQRSELAHEFQRKYFQIYAGETITRRTSVWACFDTVAVLSQCGHSKCWDPLQSDPLNRISSECIASVVCVVLVYCGHAGLVTHGTNMGPFLYGYTPTGSHNNSRVVKKRGRRKWHVRSNLARKECGPAPALWPPWIPSHHRGR